MADCVYRLNENKTTIQQIYYFEFHHCIPPKSKHMPKNHNTEDSYSAKSSSKKPALNPYNTNPNSMPALYSF